MAETLNPTPFCRCCHKNGDFKCLFSDFIYENEIGNYSQMLYDTFGILFVPSIDDKIYTICDECIEKLRISMEFKNCVLACKKNACWRGHCRARLGGGTAVTPHMKQETSEDEDSDTSIINKVSDEECNQEVKVEESGNISDETSSESEGLLIADDIKVETEETVNDEDSGINKVVDEESNEESEMKSNETFKDAGVSLRKASDIHEYKCNTYNKSFKRKGTLENHISAHGALERQTHECQECGRKFTEKGSLLRHCQNVHMGAKKYSCQYCDKRVANKYNLVLHERTHTGEKPYVCQICDKSFSTTTGLLAHNAVHLEYKPFPCNVCDKSFKSKRTLKFHMSTHTGIKPFQCSVCSKSFSRKYHFNNHMKVLHSF